MSPTRNRALVGTFTALGASHTTMRTSTRKASPSRFHASAAVSKSISTFTRCSSTPRADTLVKPEGSTRRTVAASVSAPPQPSTSTRMPGFTRTASVESRSETISMWRGSPISTSGSPAGTTLSLSRRRRSTTPSTGASTGSTRPPAASVAGIRRARARESSAAAAAAANCAPRSASSAVCTAASRASSACLVVRPDVSSLRSRARSALARSSDARARCSSAWARPTAPRAVSTAASASARVRASSSGGASACTRAITVLPRTTASPGSRSMRSTRPDTGADTTKRSCTRVSPSSSTVTTSGPRDTWPTSTVMACGHSATASSASTRAAPSRNRRLISKRHIPTPAISARPRGRADPIAGAPREPRRWPRRSR